MKKTAYLEKVAATQFTDESTVAEMKAAQKAEKALRAWWIKRAKAHLFKEHGLALAGPDSRWENGELKFRFDLKATGSIKIDEYADTRPFNASFMTKVRTWTILKSTFLTD